MSEWEAEARAWLSSLPEGKIPTAEEIDEWIDYHRSLLSDDQTTHGTVIRDRILDVHREMFPAMSQGSAVNRRNTGGVAESSGGVNDSWRSLCRAEHWLPVYSWLESLDTVEVVSNKEIKDWFRENPDIKENLSRRTRYHLMQYIQKVHAKILKRKGNFQKGMEIRKKRTAVKASRKELMGSSPIPYENSGATVKPNALRSLRKDAAFLRYELLTALQRELENLLSEGRCNPVQFSLPKKRSPETENFSGCDRENGNGGSMKAGESLSPVPDNCHALKGSKLNDVMKRKRIKAEFTPAWSFCDVLSGKAAASSTQNIVRCLKGRELGASWACCSRDAYVGRNKEKWIPFLEGWKTLGSQFDGPAVLAKRRSYSSWVPTWCAYTSSAAVAQPFGRADQSVQKVLDVRFHPEGVAQLVCSSNEAPNELLLYNLLSGKSIQLSGHNCQVQAVEFAVQGASIVSCGGNLMKPVWDATTGSCLFTLGPNSTDGGRSSVGHTKKISAMTVNGYQSCLVVTSGGMGDEKLLLWNVLTGELNCDLNAIFRAKNKASPSIEAMDFYNQNLLLCGSDSSHDGSAMVQLWDIESPESYISFPANDSYITSLKTNPDSNIVITGAGDGAVDLYDIRTCGTISQLSVGPGYEVTSVGFSKCGTYFHASSTQNNSMVWDTRLMPISPRHHLSSVALPTRPLHCLSHGKQMPTAEHTGQLPGHVDEGDQGVNDAKWLQREPVLVTVSGDGSIAMWDVALGQPCIRHLISHTRCVNTVAVSSDDTYLCTGGDDQKVVLYHNRYGTSRTKWRLSHPL
ncbi:ribonucleoside-diphosphate reductase subunit beta [Wolffia australiana]